MIMINDNGDNDNVNDDNNINNNQNLYGTRYPVLLQVLYIKFLENNFKLISLITKSIEINDNNIAI